MAILLEVMTFMLVCIIVGVVDECCRSEEWIKIMVVLVLWLEAYHGMHALNARDHSLYYSA